MKLGPVIKKTKRSNRYCGPAVISSLTGADTAETAAVLRHVNGLRKITGTSWDELLKGLQCYGIEAVQYANGARWRYAFNGTKRPTLMQWLRAFDMPEDRTYLVLSGGHWQLIKGQQYVCGISEQVVTIKDDPVRRRARVSSFAELAAFREIYLEPSVKEAIGA